MSSLSRDAQLRRIAERAAPLHERLHGPYIPVPGSENAELSRARLERWRNHAAGGDAARFRERLSWLGITEARALDVLGEVRLEGSLPSWIQTLERALDQARTRQPDPTFAASSHPFVEALQPFADAALRMLPEQCRVALALVLGPLVDDLLRELSYLAAPTLMLDLLALRGGTAGDPTSRALYGVVVARWLAEAPARYTEYAPLARLLSVTVELWVRNITELCTALERDSSEIGRLFVDGKPLGRVVAIKPSLSDRHNGARTVMRVEFECGLRLYYKPRDLGIEVAWSELVTDLAGRGSDLRPLRVLNRGSHGWAEAVEHAACRDSEEAKQFYLRAGQLLALLYVLEASDCFHENIVAAGAQPVLIDLETLMHHVLQRGVEQPQVEQLAQGILFNSVFRAGFLPTWETGPNGACVDISGLGARKGQITPFMKRRFQHLNTDAMSLTAVPITLDSEQHLPSIAGSALHVSAYTGEIVEGFQQMYRLLLECREALCAPSGRLDQLGRREIRLVFHPTRIYGLILKRLCAPRHLRDGVERSIEIDIMARFHLQSPELGRYQPLLEAEIAALEQLDIPHFTLRADSRSLPLPGGRVLERAFEEPAVERTRRRFATLSEDDLALQSSFIVASLGMSTVLADHDSGSRSVALSDAVYVPARADLLAEARRVAAELEARAIFAPDGGVTWLAPQVLPKTSHYELRALRMDLYNGVGGLALFFASLAHVSGEGRAIADAALRSLGAFVSAATPDLITRQGYSIGAATGAASFIHVLCRCAALLGEPALLDAARAAGRLISPRLIAADRTFDVMSGTAGAAMGLLALHAATGSAEALENAALCGDHLLAHRQLIGNGAAWSSAGSPPLAGFSHGAAGIALSLARLYGATGEPRFLRAAEQAVEFERSLFDENAGNWPDLRREQGDASRFMNAWCHGAAGIAIARLAGLPYLDGPGVQRDIDAGISAVVRDRSADKDGLCCGHLGRLDLLSSAAQARGDADLDALALRRAGAVIERGRASGYRASGPDQASFFDPSFFQGLSGVGYQLLRLAFPARLPSALAFS